jgi:integrase
MASIRKRGKKWLVEVRSKGKYKSKSFDTKSEAMSWSLETEQTLTGKALPKKSLCDALLRYAEECSPLKKGARWEIVRLKKISQHPMSSIVLSDFRVDDLAGWRDEQLKKLKPSSVNRELNLLSAPAPRDRRISDDEIEQVLKALYYEEDLPVTERRQEIAVAFLLSIETAMRQKEIWGLTWEHTFLEKSYVSLPETKNGFKRDVALSTRAVALLRKLNSGEKIGRVFKTNQASSGVIFLRATKLAGLKNLTFHDTRHEALTRLAQILPILDLARMVGHRDPRSLMIYYNATATEIASRLG